MPPWHTVRRGAAAGGVMSSRRDEALAAPPPPHRSPLKIASRSATRCSPRARLGLAAPP